MSCRKEKIKKIRPWKLKEPLIQHVYTEDFFEEKDFCSGELLNGTQSRKQ